jgi:protocatechuate 3,4-dioxygenase alpha subunit
LSKKGELEMLKQTGSQTVGPFFRIGMARSGENILVREGVICERIYIEGRVLDGDDQPVRDALIEIWQADAQGIYRHPADPRYQQADPNFFGLGRCGTSEDGLFTFKTIRPGVVPFDDERDQAPHVLVRVFMRGLLLHAVTRLYFSDEPANDSDPVLNMLNPAQRKILIAQRDDTEGTPTFCFDIRMQGEGAMVFFEP